MSTRPQTQSISNQAEIIGSMKDALGPVSVLTPLEPDSRYLTDWSRDHHGIALAIVRPRSVAEVQKTVAYCFKNAIPVIPQGGNTGLVSGSVNAETACVVINLELLNQVREIDEKNFSMNVDAGCLLRTVKEAAEARQLIFPLSLGSEGSCQIGGNVAANAGGVNVLRYGMMRELVLGLEVVLPDGSLWNGLGGLRKDNRGFDLKQLFIGAEGTIGIVTAACLKLYPAPEKVETAYIGVGSYRDACDFYEAARRACGDLLTGFEMIGAECLPLAMQIHPALRSPLNRDLPVHILLETSASRYVNLRDLLERFLSDSMDRGLVIDAVLANSHEQARSFWKIREGLVEGQARRGFHVRSDISVRLPQVADLVEALRDMLATRFPAWISQSYGHAGDGNVHFNALPPLDLSENAIRETGRKIEADIYRIVEEFGGSISAEHGLGRTKRERFASSSDPTHTLLMHKVKQIFDPRNLMNPGCMLNEEGLLQ